MTRVLYVDDDPDIREIATLSLGLDPSIEVMACASGPEALEAVGRWGPDIALIDVVMPGMDGPATLARLRQTEVGANLPAVFITARGRGAESERLLALGAVGVIAKPFNPMGLAATVRTHLEGARAAA